MSDTTETKKEEKVENAFFAGKAEEPWKEPKVKEKPVEQTAHDVFRAKVKNAMNILFEALHQGSDVNVVLVEQALKNTLAKAKSVRYNTAGVDYDPFPPIVA